MGIEFNISYWPIVCFKLTSNINDENFEEYKINYLNLLIKCKKNKEKILLIANLNENYDMPMKYIFKLALFNKKLFKFNKLYLDTVCIFSQSTSFKNLLKIYLSLITPSSPYKLCTSFDKINTYIKKNLNIDFDTNIFATDIYNNNQIENSNKHDLYKKLNQENINNNSNNSEIEL
jgi:hypothetical protein